MEVAKHRTKATAAPLGRRSLLNGSKWQRQSSHSQRTLKAKRQSCYSRHRGSDTDGRWSGFAIQSRECSPFCRMQRSVPIPANTGCELVTTSTFGHPQSVRIATSNLTIPPPSPSPRRIHHHSSRHPRRRRLLRFPRTSPPPLPASMRGRDRVPLRPNASSEPAR